MSILAKKTQFLANFSVFLLEVTDLDTEQRMRKFWM